LKGNILLEQPLPCLLLLFALLTPTHPLPVAADVVGTDSYFPLVMTRGKNCRPIPGVSYGTLSVNGPSTDLPAEEHPDINLALRGYVAVDEGKTLVDYGGHADPLAPQLAGLFARHRAPAFSNTYQVYDWDWARNCRGSPITRFPVTLAELEAEDGETIHVPDAGTDIGQGHVALVLYASERRLTLKYTREDNVIQGYTLHIEGICVEPSLLALYRSCNASGRAQLPALENGQAIGRARESEVGIAIRDSGSFMDPRSRKDWWQGF
jgi:hypothetical protein